jgi:repressor LexA
VRGGPRFLKEVQRGGVAGLFNLYSHNARLIENVEIEWVGEIYLIVRAPQIARVIGGR